jgi:hypothetical protein
MNNGCFKMRYRFIFVNNFSFSIFVETNKKNYNNLKIDNETIKKNFPDAVCICGGK